MTYLRYNGDRAGSSGPPWRVGLAVCAARDGRAAATWAARTGVSRDVVHRNGIGIRLGRGIGAAEITEDVHAGTEIAAHAGFTESKAGAVDKGLAVVHRPRRSAVSRDYYRALSVKCREVRAGCDRAASTPIAVDVGIDRGGDVPSEEAAAQGAIRGIAEPSRSKQSRDCDDRT